MILFLIFFDDPMVAWRKLFSLDIDHLKQVNISNMIRWDTSMANRIPDLGSRKDGSK